MAVHRAEWGSCSAVAGTIEAGQVTSLPALNDLRGRSSMPKSTCSVPGCDREHYGKGFCKIHHQRAARTGSPQEDIPIGNPGARPTEEPGYKAIHKRLVRARGSAQDALCGCGEPAHDWAYDHSGGNSERTENGKVYSLDLAQYSPMCAKCHRQFDLRHQPERYQAATVSVVIANRASATARRARTHCKHGHEWTEKNTYIYKGFRTCRECHRQNEIERRARRA